MFLKLKRDIKPYLSKIQPNELAGEDSFIHSTMSEYNLKNFNRIINSSFEGTDYEVDEMKLNDLENRLNHYFNLYAPDDEEFREFIKIISIYLIFIAKKPLHPPGIVFSNGTTVYKKDDLYHCTGKSFFIKDEMSLCKYCVCK